jgi:hypothetical protein
MMTAIYIFGVGCLLMGIPSSPIELLILGSLCYLGRAIYIFCVGCMLMDLAYHPHPLFHYCI